MQTHHIFTIFASLCYFLAWQITYAQESGKGIEQYVIKVAGKKFVPVSRITSEQLNKQFVNAVDIIRKQRELLASFDYKLGQATDVEKRKILQAQRAELADRLEVNNRYLIEHFGYSINRKFMIIVEDSHLYRPTNQQEIDQLKIDYPDRDWDSSIRRSGETVYILAKIVEGEESNRDFQAYAQTTQAQVAERNQNQAIIDQIMRGTSVEYADVGNHEEFLAWYRELENSIVENETHLWEHFGVTVESGFVRAIINSRLYVEVNSSELGRLPVEGVSVLYN